jgi:hypothetical protein
MDVLLHGLTPGGWVKKSSIRDAISYVRNHSKNKLYNNAEVKARVKQKLAVRRDAILCSCVLILGLFPNCPPSSSSSFMTGSLPDDQINEAQQVLTTCFTYLKNAQIIKFLCEYSIKSPSGKKLSGTAPEPFLFTIY